MSAGAVHPDERDRRRFRRTRLSYANVAASLALFVSLGGASYAALSLPARSVGPRQLRPGAVGVGALGFPLAATSVVDSASRHLTKGSCNSPLRPGEILPPCVPEAFGGTAPTELHLVIHAPGRLLISALAGLDNGGAPDTTADVTFAVDLDGRPVAQGDIRFSGGQLLQAHLQPLVDIAAGSHTVGFEARAHYSSNGPGDVTVFPVSLVALALP